jgi:hypothetical protein
MIGDTLVFLKNQLNAHLKVINQLDGSQPDLVEFIAGKEADSLVFKLGFVSLMLVNLEEEHTLRTPDLYHRGAANGTQQRIQPEIRLNLYVLFVAHFAEYEQSLHKLSSIIGYFQNHRQFTHTDAPDLSKEIDRLVVELVTLPFAQQNEVWSALRVSYHPSALYRVKMVVFQESQAGSAPEIVEQDLRVEL